MSVISHKIPEVVVTYGKETGEIKIEIEPSQFSSPDEFKAFARDISLFLKNETVVFKQQKFDSRAAAAHVAETLRGKMRALQYFNKLNLKDGRWRYVATS